MNTPLMVPLAAGWVEFVIFLIIMGSSVIGQIIKAVQQKAEADRRRRTAEAMRTGRPTPSPARERPPVDSRGKQPKQTPPKPVPAKVVSKPSKGQQKRAARENESLGRVAPSSNLGAELSQADERLESHLQQTFDHRLGQLSGTTSSVAEGTDAAYWSGSTSASPVANRIREMLASPQDLPAAVMLSEILRRPEERWSR